MNADTTPIAADSERATLDVYSGQIIGAAQRVSTGLGCGFLEKAILVEIKAATGLERSHRQQCINYLRATGFRVCLLLNFGQSRLQVDRLVWRF